MKIGVISDTHGHLDPRVEKIFAGVDHILHAGDIGFASIILELEMIAPVTAVLGNCDTDIDYRLTETVELARKKFLVHHIVNPRDLSETAANRITKDKPDVVVFGHTHKRFAETLNGILYFNPGYSGKPKHGSDRSVAILHLEGKTIRHEFIGL
ncbi:MAG TPA: metallophosphoesterase family protein [Candidatus Acidoferrales bacterium]|nr:metallophosphoesterase family protein [Candidatus Acidoferrales bacterium]